MTSAIGRRPVQMRNVEAPRLSQEAGATVKKVIAFVGLLMTSIVSFLLLPFEGALFTSLCAGMLFSAFTCQGSRRAPNHRSDGLTKEEFMFL